MEIFECEYCKTKFLTEENYKKHKCDNEIRVSEVNTPRGERVFDYYVLWFKERSLPAPSKEIFIGSKYYNTFFKFHEYATKMHIPDINLYIKLMSKESILPQHWYNDDIYNFFLDHLDNECSYMTHVRITLSSLERLASSLDCKISEVFDKIGGRKIIDFIQSRNFSPWVLLFSNKFKQFLQNSASPEEHTLVEKVIDLDKWRKIIADHEDDASAVKDYLKQLDL